MRTASASPGRAKNGYNRAKCFFGIHAHGRRDMVDDCWLHNCALNAAAENELGALADRILNERAHAGGGIG